MKRSLVLGIGNIGKEFQGTRHNLGFDILDLLAQEMRSSFLYFENIRANLAVAESVDFGKLFMLKPTTLVNGSGFTAKNGIKNLLCDKNLNDFIVVYDDVESYLGKVVLKFGGSHKGHNGVRDIIDKLGTKDFFRLSIGIGKPKTDLSEFVLSKFSIDELSTINESKLLALYKLKDWVFNRGIVSY